MKTADRYLLHTIHANTLSAGPRKSSGWGGTIFVLALTLGLCVLALWTDRAFV